MKKRLLAGFLTLAMLAGLFPVSALAAEVPAFSGSGTEDEPYRISTAEDLAALAENIQTTTAYSSAHYVLTQDIDLSRVCGADIGGEEKSWTPIGICVRTDYETFPIPFRGTFDGGGHTITGLHINASGGEYQGLFGYVSGEGSGVHDLTVSRDVTGRSYIGGIIGVLGRGGTAADCHYSGQG